jgi:hypothetical protein
MGYYRAWVRGIAADGTAAIWSPVTDFYVAPAAVVTAGMNSTFDRTPTFAWNAVTGATSYEVKVRNRQTGVAVISQTGVTSTSWTVPSDLPDGPYRWWVVAVSATNLRSQSAVPHDIYIGGRPDLRVPVVGSDRRPLFSWSTIDGAASYVLQVNRIDVPQTNVILASALSSPVFQATTALPVGTYRAWVRAISTSGQLSPWSLEVNFSVG